MVFSFNMANHHSLASPIFLSEDILVLISTFSMIILNIYIMISVVNIMNFSVHWSFLYYLLTLPTSLTTKLLNSGCSAFFLPHPFYFFSFRTPTTIRELKLPKCLLSSPSFCALSTLNSFSTYVWFLVQFFPQVWLQQVQITSTNLKMYKSKLFAPNLVQNLTSYM